MSHIEVIRNLRLSESDELNVMSQDQEINVTEIPIIQTDFDSELNQAVIYDPNDPDDHDMLVFLGTCFKKRSKLVEINSRNQRDFQIIYVNQVLKGVKQMLVELN